MTPYRFSERIFIPDRYTRHLLIDFVKKGVDELGFTELIECSSKHISCLVEFLKYLKLSIEQQFTTKATTSSIQFKCPEEWSDFVYALASPSPVCALIRPVQSVLMLLERMHMTNEDLRCDPVAMNTLQHEIPVIYKLLCSLNQIPLAIHPILKRLMNLSKAPFARKIEYSTEMPHETDDMKYLPKLPKLRTRKLYSADSIKAQVCTKKSYGHPTLLPGIFTIYCSHGN